MIDSFRAKAEMIGEIAQGDLAGELALVSENDEFGRHLGRMRDSLTELMSNVRGAVEQVSTGSDQVAQASQALSQGATEQASSLEEISSSLNQINSQSRQNAENASEASALSKAAVATAESGNEQMMELQGAMSRINASSDEIKKVVKVIDDIAFQINLLALNANVEAARAGQYGKGFAVVADEVRNLAVRSAEAVKETTGMVEESIKNTEHGGQVVEKTAKQLEEIVSSSGKIANFLEEISLASKEQAQAIEQINDGIEQIDHVTQGNTASAEQSASAAEELAAQAKDLERYIGHFRLRDGVGEPVAEPKTKEFANEPRPERNRGGNHRELVTAGVERGEQQEPERKDPAAVIKLDDDDFGRF
jgi:methyl-accepting chemotaxis protein